MFNSEQTKAERNAAQSAGTKYEDVQFSQPYDQAIQALQKRTALKYSWEVADVFLALTGIESAFADIAGIVGGAAGLRILPQVNAITFGIGVLQTVIGKKAGFTQESWDEALTAYSAEFSDIKDQFTTPVAVAGNAVN
jgi:hypothetical protein